MGTVAIKFRIMPEGPEVDLSALETAISEMVTSKGADLQGVQIKPFAFGLMAMEMAITMPDSAGNASDAIEEALQELEGVQSVDVLEVGLL
jgi:elongation factor 1-beta